MPVASAVPPPSAREEHPSGPIGDGDGHRRPLAERRHPPRAQTLGAAPGPVPGPARALEPARPRRQGPRRISTPLTTSRAGGARARRATGLRAAVRRRPPARRPASRAASAAAAPGSRAPQPRLMCRTSPSPSTRNVVGKACSPQRRMISPGEIDRDRRSRPAADSARGTPAPSPASSPASTSTNRTRGPSAVADRDQIAQRAVAGPAPGGEEIDDHDLARPVSGAGATARPASRSRAPGPDRRSAGGGVCRGRRRRRPRARAAPSTKRGGHSSHSSPPALEWPAPEEWPSGRRRRS